MASSTKKNVSKTVSNVFNQARNQAKESLKLLEAFEKETLKKARTFVKMPAMASNRSKLTNEKILASLSRLGVASQAEVAELKARIEALEEQLTSKKSVRASSAASTSSDTIPQG